MPLTSYVYSILNDCPSGAVNTAKLSAAILANTNFTIALDRIDTVVDDLEIWFRDALPIGQQNILDGGSGGAYGTHPAGGLISTTDNTPTVNPPSQVSIIGDEVGDDYESKVTTVGGQGIGGFVPSAARGPVSVERNKRSIINLDSEGNVAVRGNSFSDEGSFRDDFPGDSLFSDITGTLTIDSDSYIVTGSGTSFLDEIDRDSYIKVTADSETKWVLVGRVISDTLLELDSLYTGTTGSTLDCQFTKWPTKTGAHSPGISVSSGIAIIQSGTTINETTELIREGDYLPMVAEFRCRVSQRIVGTEIVIGFKDDGGSTDAMAVLVFDGTDNTKVKLRTACGNGDNEIQESTVRLPIGMTTNNFLNYQIGAIQSSVSLSVEGTILINNNIHIPGPYDEMHTVIGTTNTGTPASSTSIEVDFVLLKNHDTTAIEQPNNSAPIPCNIVSDVSVAIKQERKTVGHYRPHPFTIEVPSDKVRYLDWTIPGYTNGIDWVGLIFNASDVSSGDEIVMGKGLMGKIGVLAANASIGATEIYVASSPGVLTTTARDGAIDEGFYLSIGTENSVSGPFTGADSGTLNGEADGIDHGEDINPNQELKEFEIIKFTDQDADGVSKITLATSLAANITAGSDVNLVVRVISPEMPVTKGHVYNFGGACLRAGNLPGGSIIRVGYRNNSEADEVVRAYLETMR